MQEKKINLLITGGTGFFGKSILAFIKNNYFFLNFHLSVFVVTRNKKNFLSRFSEFDNIEWLTFIDYDIFKNDHFDLGPIKIDLVIHAASESTSNPYISSLDLFNQIVLGTKKILDFAVKAKVNKFLYISSGAVNGLFDEKIQIKENFYNAINHEDLKSFYALCKKQAEGLCFSYYNDFNLSLNIARCFAFMGPYMPISSHYVVTEFIKKSLENSDINIIGNPDTTRSYMYQDDLANWLLRILFDGETGQIFNVGSPYFITIKELAKLIIKLTNSNSKINLIENKSRINHYVPDVEKTKNFLNLDLTYNLNKSIKLTTDSYIKNKKNYD